MSDPIETARGFVRQIDALETVPGMMVSYDQGKYAVCKALLERDEEARRLERAEGDLRNVADLFDEAQRPPWNVRFEAADTTQHLRGILVIGTLSGAALRAQGERDTLRAALAELAEAAEEVAQIPYGDVDEPRMEQIRVALAKAREVLG